ncbi:hypothetical protein OGAPHI_006414 [Ogataea philodendri]|uniref:Uncharacterized protein n=1 Tax=Ogataea philodendri TaxID=1378263 RepID=A0A9P8T1D8_9ASCO|nr:uncharacterized protein OGAPHI_006414 [Ogataea philodendri]KAH3661566.1 hypothetical protein OGAPHI_006414 [Ogataea philodendri]
MNLSLALENVKINLIGDKATDSFFAKNRILIGCLSGILSSACQSVGLILQRKSHLICESSGSGSTIMTPYKRSLWHLGFSLFIISNVFGSSIQLSTLPVIILSPLQSIGLVFNTIFNSLILNEKFTLGSFYGTGLVGFGAFLIALFGSFIDEPEYNLSQFLILLAQKEFIGWLILEYGIVIFFLWWIHVSGKHATNSSSTIDANERTNMVSPVRPVYNQVLGIFGCETTNNVQEREPASSPSRPPSGFTLILVRCGSFFHHLLFTNSSVTTKSIQGVLYGVTSGILSAHSLLLAKSAIEIALSTIINHNIKQLNNLTAYLIVLTFLVLCLSQLFMLNQGLKLISTSILYPLVFCVYSIFSILNGLTFYQQWSQFWGWVGFFILLGTILVVIGVFVLSNCPISEHIQNTESSGLKPPESPIANQEVENYQSILQVSPSQRNRKKQLKNGVVSSFISFSDPSDAESPYYEHFPHAPDRSSSSSNPSPKDLIKPMIRKTGENLNSAGRKVSGFLKRSIDSINQPLPLIPKQFNGNADNQNSIKGFDAMTTSSNLSSSHIGYVSFGSMKESSITDLGVASNSNIEDRVNLSKEEPQSMNVTKMSAQLKPISPDSGRKENASALNNHPDLSIMYGVSNRILPDYNDHSDYNSLSSGDKQMRSQTGKSDFEREFGELTDLHSNNPALRTTDIHKKSYDEIGEDYNPNNSFNFSLNHTIEEIQNQLNGYSERIAPSHTPPRSLSKHLEEVDKSNDSTYVTEARIQKKALFGTHFSPNTVNGGVKPMTPSSNSHLRVNSRIFSFEQKELYDELTNV